MSKIEKREEILHLTKISRYMVLVYGHSHTKCRVLLRATVINTVSKPHALLDHFVERYI